MVVRRNLKRLAAVGLFLFSTMLICTAGTALIAESDEPVLAQRYVPRKLMLDDNSTQTANSSASTTPAPTSAINDVYNALEVSSRY